jgi:hypothetical protein
MIQYSTHRQLQLLFNFLLSIQLQLQLQPFNFSACTVATWNATSGNGKIAVRNTYQMGGRFRNAQTIWM